MAKVLEQRASRWPLGFYQTAWVVVLILVSAGLWWWALRPRFQSCAQPDKPDEWLVQTAATLDATVDLGIKIAISLVGAGGALLVGLRATDTAAHNDRQTFSIVSNFCFCSGRPRRRFLEIPSCHCVAE